ncbi:MAG: 2-oxoglutarate and iron-dependent oxygenase domain-containing protein, partial [Pseudomonadota bacterium]|nr:2-oxoglutarate and iron-dependent oxygenase domain-containing protein [Pseudomonadota bacterium]
MEVNALPLIDISNFQSGNLAAKKTIATQVARACMDIGFFAISGHGVENSVINNLRDASHNFFSQSDEFKHKFVHPIEGTPRGFRTFRGEALGKTSGQADAQPDLKEFYHIGREQIPLDDPYYTSEDGKKYFIPNLWPDHPLEFKAAALAYWDSMEALAINLA